MCGSDPIGGNRFYLKIDEHGGDEEIPAYRLVHHRVTCGTGSCPPDLTLSDTTVTGTQTFGASDTLTLGSGLTVDGDDVTVAAGQRIVVTSGTAIGGTFRAVTGPDSCTL